MKRTVGIGILVLSFALCGAAPAQEPGGMVDLNSSVEHQIQQLEQLVGGDVAARKQAVSYLWLIELYGYLGRDDDIERCFERILAFFPNDVGTLNKYAVFLMDNRADLERAQKTLYDAYQWGKATDARAVDMGTTFALLAEVHRRRGDFEDAVRLSGKAIDLMSEERGAKALRTMAGSLLALERYDDAADAYLRLIGIERAANTEDINALKLFAGRTTKYAKSGLQHYIDEAVSRQRTAEAARIELEGGELVTVKSGDGVPLEATLRRTDGPGAVLFVHEMGSRRSVFTPYAQLLSIDEISSLTIDLRGHGGSLADSMLTFDALSPDNLDRLADDVAAGFRYVEKTLGIDARHIAIVAEGHACAVVEKALYRERIAAPVVYLSPTFQDDDLELRTALSFHPDRDALVICAREDWSALKALDRFTEGAERATLAKRLYEDAGHGVETLRRTPAALEFLQGWLRRTVGSG